MSANAMNTMQTDRVIVVGSGLAGLATALSLAPLPVLIVTAGQLGKTGSSDWAQGGIAAAIGSDDDPCLHAQDTLAAGAGLSELAIAHRVAAAAPRCVETLAQWGVRFDLDGAGNPALTLEGAHSRRRILHSGGDRTGASVMAALVERSRATPSIDVLEQAEIVELLLNDGEIVGALAAKDSSHVAILGRGVVLAAGGASALYASTTNPLGNWGSGLILARRAGAILRDLEFVQFHPTAIAASASFEGGPLALASEAIRGEGATLVDESGTPVMAGIPGGDLAPRDRVARALWDRIQAGHEVFLDAREALGHRFPQRFPHITARCRAAGIDPVTRPIPVRPVAHYHMGGVRVDASGRTDVAGLWAVGEIASTGLHGANRLASNSLLEAIAGGSWVAEDLQGCSIIGSPRCLSASQASHPGRYECHERSASPTLKLRQLMESHVGVVRDRSGLQAAVARLAAIGEGSSPNDPLRRMAEVGLLIATAALNREESRGAHSRRDFPETTQLWARHQDIAAGTAQETCAPEHGLERLAR